MKWGKGVELDIQTDVNNLYGRYLTIMAASYHPSWEVSEADYSIRFFGGKGPRTPRGLERWFLREHPKVADELWQAISDEVRRGRRGKHT